MSTDKLVKILITLVIIHCIGIIVFIAFLDARAGCSTVEQPKYCSLYKNGAAAWEIIVLYHVTYSILDGE